MAQKLWIAENFDTMTFPECLSFIARSRRQLDRLKQEDHGKVDQQEIASIRETIDALEIRIRLHPSCPA